MHPSCMMFMSQCFNMSHPQTCTEQMENYKVCLGSDRLEREQLVFSSFCFSWIKGVLQYLYDAERKTEESLDAKFASRREGLQSFTKLKDDFAGRICYKYQDGLRECVENQSRWPMIESAVSDPCVNILGLAQQYYNVKTNDSELDVKASTVSVINTFDASLHQNSSKIEPNTDDCNIWGYQILNLLKDNEFEFGLLLGLGAYVFYVTIGQLLVRKLGQAHNFIFHETAEGSSLSESFKCKEPEVTLQLVPPHYLDSTLV